MQSNKVYLKRTTDNEEFEVTHARNTHGEWFLCGKGRNYNNDWKTGTLHCHLLLQYSGDILKYKNIQHKT